MLGVNELITSTDSRGRILIDVDIRQLTASEDAPAAAGGGETAPPHPPTALN